MGLTALEVDRPFINRLKAHRKEFVDERSMWITEESRYLMRVCHNLLKLT